MQRYLRTLSKLIAAVIIFLAFAYTLLLVVVLGSGERWDEDSEQAQRAESAAVVEPDEAKQEEPRQTSVAVTKTARQATPLSSWPPQEALNLQASEPAQVSESTEPEPAEEMDDYTSGRMNLLPIS